jgi:hypothetical protein
MTSPSSPIPLSAPTIFEFQGFVWSNGEADDIDTLMDELPAVELGSGDAPFCEIWLGQMAVLSDGCSARSWRVLVRFVLNQLIHEAVEEFCDTFGEWETDADPETTHQLVRRLERWLTGRCYHRL